MVEGTSTTFSSWFFYKLLLFGETILILCSRIAPIARILSVTCFSTTEMTDFTDFVSIACSLRH